MKCQQLSAEERVIIAALRKQGMGAPQIGYEIGQHRSTVWRELRRNRAPYDGGYRSARAHERAGARRKRARRNQQFGKAELGQVEALLRERWSPEQISGTLRRNGQLSISHEAIYRHAWADRRRGGGLHLPLRCAAKARRKRYGRYDSRGGWRASATSVSARWAWKDGGGTVTGRSTRCSEHERMRGDAGGAPDRLPAGGQAQSADGGRDQPGHHRVDQAPPASV